MLASRRQAVSIYVDKLHQQWIVRDPDGNFWTMPSMENPWDHRAPFDPGTAETDLDPVPAHYKYMLELPF